MTRKTKTARTKQPTVARKVKAAISDATTRTTSSYDPALCARVLELGKEGKSRAQIARALAVSYSTMMRWAAAHPEFEQALKDAYYLAMAFFEDVGATGMQLGQRFNAATFVFLAKNRFSREYRDRQEHAITETPPAPTARPGVPDLSGVTDPKEALRMFEEFRMVSGKYHT